jgi:hypothetical protein
MPEPQITRPLAARIRAFHASPPCRINEMISDRLSEVLPRLIARGCHCLRGPRHHEIMTSTDEGLASVRMRPSRAASRKRS